MAFRCGVSWLVVLLSACGSSPPAPTDVGADVADGGAPPDVPDAQGDAVDIDVQASDAGYGIEAFRADYGLLETVAGSGLVDDVNGWRLAFEGGAAVDAELSRPHMTMADAAGNLYIADKDAHAIRRVDTSGLITTVAGTSIAGFDGDDPAPAASSRLNSPNGLWVFPDGTLFILDLGNDRVRKVTPAGEMSTLFQIGGAGTGRGLWVAPDESLAYVSAGSRLLRWTPAGGALVLSQGFVSLGNLHVSSDGRLGVTDRAGHQVYLIAEDGTKTEIAGNGTVTGGGDGSLATETGLEEVRGIWFHPQGGMLLVTHDGCQLWFVDPSGAIHLVLDGDKGEHAGDGEHFSTPGEKISEPRGVSMDHSGNILITEHDNGHVRRILHN